MYVCVYIGRPLYKCTYVGLCIYVYVWSLISLSLIHCNKMSSRKKLVHPYCPDEVGRRRRIRGNVWGDDETETLLKLWKAPGVQGELRSVKRNQHVYAFIANQLKHNGVKVSRTRGYTMVSAYLL